MIIIWAQLLGGHMKNILIISSDHTGHGHKSISESLKEQFHLHEDVQVHIIDGFELGGSFWLKFGKSYGTITRNAEYLWKIAWKIQSKRQHFIHAFAEQSIRENFLKVIKDISPDLILSVHPLFNTSIINILRSYKIKIPFATFIADLVSISPLWVDKRATCIICPTQEAKERCKEFGIREHKLKVIGFPVRAKFVKHTNDSSSMPSLYSLDRPLECLIMSGGEGSGDMNVIAEILLKNFNCNVHIIAGRNASIKEKLEKTLCVNYPGRVDVTGYVNNIQDYMLDSDIAITRGSPNVMMESVACNIPFIITSALPGQEKENPDFAVNNNLGVYCPNINKLADTISELLDDNARKLNEIKISQQKFYDYETAKKIVEHTLSLIKDSKSIPTDFRKKRSKPQKIRLMPKRLLIRMGR